MLNTMIYGMGRWGKTLVGSVEGSEKIRFVKGVSRHPENHADFVKATGIEVSASYTEALKAPDVDAVVLATPHSMHGEHIIRAAQAGKHVYVEKPMTLTRAEAEAAVDACRQAGVTLAVGFNRRYAPAFLAMKDRIRDGRIGTIVHIDAANTGPQGHTLKPDNWRSTREESPAGGMSPRGIHTLDSMIQIAGLATRVYSVSGKRILPPEITMDDTTSMLLSFAGGATGCLTTITATGEMSRIQVFGSKGWLDVRGDTELIACGLDGQQERVVFEAIDKERAILEAFAEAVAAGRPFLVPPAEAINGVAVIEAVVKSSDVGQPIDIR